MTTLTEINREIRRQLKELQAELDNIMAGDDEETRYRAYGRCGFDQVHNGNPYDMSLPKLIEGGER